ncbi:MAG: type II toxin-antitoxin system prevent-host-death family antitoxin [Alphaproteobacteria bacterium]|nr:type II toxin-antitoxin system prevent-host-death family antitoxin [Alphaproteobacteria bacterium]MDP6833250.1 type II toxin-antitoxin system prevent-host-death family antitoxin [Alphaproteobacteria bacterium]
MLRVSITEFRGNLPLYLQKVKTGVELQITSHGKSIARLVPEQDEVEKASARLSKLRGTMITGNVVDPIDAEWGGDADNL